MGVSCLMRRVSLIIGKSRIQQIGYNDVYFPPFIAYLTVSINPEIIKMNKQEAKQSSSKLISLPNKKLSTAELAICLSILAKQYNLQMPHLIRKLDKVSGNLHNLINLLNGNYKLQWTQSEDQLLEDNSMVLVRWRGVDDVQRRKQYLAFNKAKDMLQGQEQKCENKRT